MFFTPNWEVTMALLLSSSPPLTDTLGNEDHWNYRPHLLGDNDILQTVLPTPRPPPPLPGGLAKIRTGAQLPLHCHQSASRMK